MKTCEDVLAGSGIQYTTETMSPFGVGVYKRCASEDTWKMMPLYYVSKAVCDDRSQSAPPMQPGWYLPVDELDTEFEVRVSATGKEPRVWETMWDAVCSDIAIANLFVDGVDCNNYGAAIERFDSMDVKFRGFAESSARSVSGGSATIRAFSFSKAQVRDEDAALAVGRSASTVGELRVQFKSANKGGARISEKSWVQGGAVVAKDNLTSERDAVKKGTSVSVRTDGRAIVEKASVVPYVLVDVTRQPHLDITIFIRERVWLQSRRVIDEAGAACTKAAAKDIAAKSVAKTSPSPPPTKRVKRELLEADIIDLT